MKKITKILLISVFLISFLFNCNCQDFTPPTGFPKLDISIDNSPDDSYLFLDVKPISKVRPSSLVIIDNYGIPIFYQHIPAASGSFALLDNGLLAFRTKLTATPKFYIMDSTYQIVDSLGMSDYSLDSHDIIGMKNGHYIIFGNDYRVTDLTEFGGEPDATVSGCVVRELDENKNIVFEWNTWDHFEISDTYNDLTVSAVEMVHPNSLEIDYDGNILLISRALNEVTKINRLTGEIIWRLGGKNNQFIFKDSSQMFSMPHDIQLLENGNYTLFDNGNERNPSYSRAIEYNIDEVNMTIEMVWEYDANKEIFSPSGGSTKRLPSGNTILGLGGTANHPAVIEVHPDGSKAWQLDFVNEQSSAKAIKNPWRTNLFEPNKYQINFGEWDGYTPSTYLLTITNNSGKELVLTGYSTRTDAFSIEETFPVSIPAHGSSQLSISYFPNTIDYGHINDVLTIDSDIDSDTLIRRVSQQIKLSGTLTDTKAPSAIISIDGEMSVPLDQIFTVIFSEPIRNVNEEVFTYANIDQIFTFKSVDANGNDIPFDAVINTEKNKVEITPFQVLDHTQTYFLAVSDQYADFSGNQGASVSGSFKTIDLTSPNGIINPANGLANVNPDENISISFDEPVRNTDNSLLNQSSLDTLIIFKSPNAEGEDVLFSATINEENTLISISTTERLLSGTSYYISLKNYVEDFNNNLLTEIISEFTTGFYEKVGNNDYSIFEVFPNPGSGIYHLKINVPDTINIQVFDIAGKLVFRENDISTNYILDISSQSNGQYFLKLSSEKTGSLSSVIIIKE